MRPLTAALIGPLVCCALAACRTVDGGPTPDETDLANLGLVYDDTIVTRSARTVDFNGQAFAPRLVHVQKSGMGSELDADIALTRVVLGFHEDFTVLLALPYVSKRLDRPAGAPTLRAEGLGDAALVGKLRLLQRTAPGETTEAAALFGLKLPTGRDGVRSAGMLVPAPLQPGSGSLDAILGGAFTRIRGRWLLNADLVARIHSEANDYRFGNLLQADVGGHFRAFPARYVRSDQTTVNLVAELNGLWSGRDRQGGVPVGDSGGTKLFVTPGLQVVVTERLLVEAAVQIPIVTNLGGSQLEEDFVAIFGLRLRF